MKALLRLAGLSRSTFYYHQTKSKVDKYKDVKSRIIAIFQQNKARYGYRRVHEVLRQSGVVINHKTTQRLMSELGLMGKQRRSKYRSYRGEVGRIAPNILQRDFKASRPFEKLVTDVTEFAVCDEKVYLSPVMDLFNHEIVSYSISSRADFMQTREMLRRLFRKLPKGSKPLMHSDQGWQYQMREYLELLKKHGITQSMSRKGNCLDNGAMENFFGRLKVEMFFGEHFESVEDFKRKLADYICYFNQDRISLKLGSMSPVQYRRRFAP